MSISAAFIIAGIVFVISTAIAALTLFAAGMSDNPSASADASSMATTIFFGGMIVAALVAATHFIHMSW